MNQVILMGRLTRDPELKTTTGAGKKVATFGLATDRGGSKNAQGQKEVDFHNIVCWEKNAEVAEKYLGKGKQVLIIGKVQYRNYPDPKDANRKVYVTEIITDRLEFVGDKGSNQSAPATTQASMPTSQFSNTVDMGDDFYPLDDPDTVL